MTYIEREEFKKWNIAITEGEHLARDKAIAIEDKYFRINESHSRENANLLFEIANTEKVDKEERLRDILDYIKYIEANAKLEALDDILHIY